MAPMQKSKSRNGKDKHIKDIQKTATRRLPIEANRALSVEAVEERDELKRNIKALGGDDEDYEMVKHLGKGVVLELNDVVTGKKLQKDVKGFFKSLNFEAVASSAVVDSAPAVVDESSEASSDVEEEEDEEGEEIPIQNGAVASTSNKPEKRTSSVDSNPHWYASIPPLPPLPPSELPPITPSELLALRQRASSLFTALPPPPSTSASDKTFISQILSSGTLSDRLSALTLMVQASPIHNIKALDSLKNMASKKGREESLKALRAIVDWWIGGGGPDWKLKYFEDQSLTHPSITSSHLIYYQFEDWLKKYFFAILQLLEQLSLDHLPYVRTQALTLISQLLISKPEQEQNLLRLLVNKLGDSEKPISSKTSYLLLQLLQKHPSMKAILVREISSLILRPQSQSSNSNGHAKYYGVITFNQIMLKDGEEDRKVAAQLVDIYFLLFRDILKDGGGKEEDEAVRTDPKEEDGRDGKKKHKKQWKGKDKKNSKDKKNAKGKGKEKASIPEGGFAETEDSDSKMISAILTGVNRAFPFAKMDDDVFEKHIDTLFRITHEATFNVSVQALLLILQVTSKKSVSDRFYRTLYNSLLDPRLPQSSKQAMYLNLLFKSIKMDTSKERVAAFVRRLIQSLGMHPGVEFCCGVLYLLGELFNITPGLRDMIQEPQKERPPSEDKRDQLPYDSKKRDPQYAGAYGSCLWELIPLRNHFHPSISLHARQLLTNAALTANADLGLNTLAHFLDRFVYKNPKKKTGGRGVSAMQPAAGGLGDSGIAVRNLRMEDKSGVNEQGFWKRKVEEVPVDQLFFHKFFLGKLEKKQKKVEKVEKRRKGKKEESSDGEVSKEEESGEDEEEDEDEDEDEIWKAMKASMPGPGADDDDGDISDSIPEISEDSDEDSTSDAGDSDVEGSEASLGEEDNDEDGLSLADEDDEDMIPWESAFPDEDGEEEGASGKRKLEGDGEGKRKKRRKVGGLPTFASYEDYAKMIEEGPEDDV